MRGATQRELTEAHKVSQYKVAKHKQLTEGEPPPPPGGGPNICAIQAAPVKGMIRYVNNAQEKIPDFFLPG